MLCYKQYSHNHYTSQIYLIIAFFSNHKYQNKNRIYCWFKGNSGLWSGTHKKYNGEEFIKCSKSEYKVDKIKFNFDSSIYKYTFDNGIYKTIDNSKLKQLIHNSEIKIEKENNNKIYYSLEDNFYMYTPENGSEIIFYNYELSFNNKNTIFVYIDN